MIIPETIKVPQSVDEAFKMLDEMLDKEDKQAILDGEDVHFGLGLWIRNEWLYGPAPEESQALRDDLKRISEVGDNDGRFPCILLLTDGDNFSETLISLYSDHLLKEYALENDLVIDYMEISKS